MTRYYWPEGYFPSGFKGYWTEGFWPASDILVVSGATGVSPIQLKVLTRHTLRVLGGSS